MLAGVILIIASTLAYNGSVVLLAVASRTSRESDASLIISAAGLGFLLLLTSLALKEPLGRAKLAGMVLMALGLAAVAVFPPGYGGASPAGWEWAVLVVVSGSIIALPYALRTRGASYLLLSVSSGVAYALTGIFTKGLVDAAPSHPSVSAIESVFTSGSFPALALLGLGLIASSVAAFDAQLRALRRLQASVAAPVILALHTVVPIAAAPLLFQEAWPAGLVPHLLLGGGILLTLTGTLALSATSRRSL
jgi:drug/metabolite transporter (DMT)-like permease